MQHSSLHQKVLLCTVFITFCALTCTFPGTNLQCTVGKGGSQLISAIWASFLHFLFFLLLSWYRPHIAHFLRTISLSGKLIQLQFCFTQKYFSYDPISSKGVAHCALQYSTVQYSTTYPGGGAAWAPPASTQTAPPLCSRNWTKLMWWRKRRRTNRGGISFFLNHTL